MERLWLHSCMESYEEDLGGVENKAVVTRVLGQYLGPKDGDRLAHG